ncbi:phosphoribosyltransferase [Candidatus Micrarchaeota archaeon]|nr:phosphoribosyltransferase [Candidatus Micrarchaeota archaeon]
MLDALKLGWADVERMSYVVAKKSLEFNPDAIVGISRGGFIPAVLISDELNVHDVYAVNVKYYEGFGKTKRTPELLQRLDSDYLEGRRVLLVDDLIDKGHSMKTAFEAVQEASPKEVRTATLFYKPPSPAPDYYAEKTNQWVVFPWEKRESLEWFKETEQTTQP